MVWTLLQMEDALFKEGKQKILKRVFTKIFEPLACTIKQTTFERFLQKI